MFQLTKEEIELLRLQKNQDNEIIPNLRFQIETSSLEESWGGTRYLPYAFTEQGVAMLSSVLNSPAAIKVNIEIIRVFTKIRKVLTESLNVKLEIEEIKKKLINHDKNIELVFNYLDEMIEKQENKVERNKIGYKK
jgi:hypothetical protein